ncbi:hypothetical protein AHAS_Ahas13G0321300 [Arachis hypogaea]|uniref:Uncharacterized protein n=1 Tax=Arachis hypogaea TaxID=3818 RepID=A0A444ZZU9_ARAHY|nr:hypothetical protein Ahy_B03g064576 isoform B [Arachis hypogaea]
MENTHKSGDIIQCREYGYHILYKKRTRCSKHPFFLSLVESCCFHLSHSLIHLLIHLLSLQLSSMRLGEKTKQNWAPCWLAHLFYTFMSI